MEEIKGKYSSAKVFTNIIEETASAQIKDLCNQVFAVGQTIRIMPDVHAGMGCTIGTAMTITDKVVPNMVGVDIGCGMEVARLNECWIDLAALDAYIHENVPAGFNIRATPHILSNEIDLSLLRCASHVDIDRAYKSIGTLGGGNHFIEADKDDDGNIYIVIHSGSRHLGCEVAEYYQNEGYHALCGNTQAQIKELISELKAQGRASEIESRVKELKAQSTCPVQKDLAYVEGALFDDYIHDMKITQQFAALNRRAMMDNIVLAMCLTKNAGFTTTHNYIDTDAMILRKGAVSAKHAEVFIVPINMRDGSLICVGKGNPDWNYSAPHGAGRLYSRMAAKRNFTVAEFQNEMEGIYTTTADDTTLDECPMAYKGMKDIVDNISPTAEIIKVIKPIYNFKASETPKRKEST